VPPWHKYWQPQTPPLRNFELKVTHDCLLDFHAIGPLLRTMA